MGPLIDHIAKRLVDSPDEVSVNEKQDGGVSMLELKVAPADIGKVIGRQGRTARALRTILSVAAGKRNARYSLDILE